MKGGILLTSKDENVRMDGNGIHFIFEDRGGRETRMVSVPNTAFDGLFIEPDQVKGLIKGNAGKE
jgi:hypothetical protein